VQIAEYVDSEEFGRKLEGFSPEEATYLKALIRKYYPTIKPVTPEVMLGKYPWIKHMDKFRVLDPLESLKRIGKIKNNKGKGFFGGYSVAYFDATFAARESRNAGYQLSPETLRRIAAFALDKEVLMGIAYVNMETANGFPLPDVEFAKLDVTSNLMMVERELKTGLLGEERLFIENSIKQYVDWGRKLGLVK
jgi:hypothetical protein